MPSARLDYDLWWRLEQHGVSPVIAVRAGVDGAGAGERTLDLDVQRYGYGRRVTRRLGGGARRIHRDAGRRRRDVRRRRRHRCSRKAVVFAVF